MLALRAAVMRSNGWTQMVMLLNSIVAELMFGAKSELDEFRSHRPSYVDNDKTMFNSRVIE
jgi:hypothetical protein